MLELQGVKLVVPSSLEMGELEGLRASVVVAPPRGPERPLAEALARASGARLVASERPRRALYVSLAHPSGVFGELAVGVDPGDTCAAAALGDGLLIWTWRGPCVDLPAEVERLSDDVDALRFRVYVGFGSGGREAALALGSLGYEVRGVPEEGSSSSPYNAPLGLSGAIDDEHVLAALTIAYKGLTRW
jgi:hypothetical protein